MDKNLHDIEDLFRSGLDDNEEMPSAKVWDTVDSQLDKDTVASIKKKYKTWKRLSLLLLLLLIGFSIYEIGIRRTGIGFSKTNNSAGTSNQQLAVDNANNNNTGNSITDNSTPYNKLADNKSENNFNPEKSDQPNPATNENVFVNNNAGFQLFPASVKKNNPQKTKNDDPVKENSALMTEDNAVPVNEPSAMLRQFNLISPEKINRPDFATTDIKKIWESLALTKNTPSFIAAVAAPVKKKQSQPGRFSITAFYSPDIASYHLEEDQPGNQPETASKIRKGERHEFSSTSGLLLDYRLNKHWSLQSGLSFSNTNLKIDPKTIYAQTDNNGNVKYRVNISSGYGYILPSFQSAPVIGDSLKITAATHKLRYVGIPIAVKYSAGKGNLRFEATAGVAANFLTRGKLETEVKKGPDDEVDVLNNIQGLKSVYFSGLAGAGVEYKLTKKLSVTLMPTARFALNPINKSAVVKTLPNSFGLSCGIKIEL